MAANPNGFGYWIRNGSVLPAYTLGKVAGTADFNYWWRNGAIMYPAAIQPVPKASPTILPPSRIIIVPPVATMGASTY